MKKRLLAMLLTAVMAAGLLSLSACGGKDAAEKSPGSDAAGTPTAPGIPAVSDAPGSSYEPEKGVTWFYENGVLTVSGTGPMADYNMDDAVPPWYGYRESVTEVVIEDGVTSIGDLAFYNCRALTGVTIPDSVTSIGKSAFSYCSGLISVTIPNSVTSIGEYAFRTCSGLTGITISDSVTSIEKATFFYCTSLTGVTIPDSVISIGDSAFMGCTSLTSVTIPDSVANIESNAFGTCFSLTSVTIPAGVTSIANGAFDFFSLTDIYYGGSESQWEQITGGNGGSVLVNIHYNS